MKKKLQNKLIQARIEANKRYQEDYDKFMKEGPTKMNRLALGISMERLNRADQALINNNLREHIT